MEGLVTGMWDLLNIKSSRKLTKRTIFGMEMRPLDRRLNVDIDEFDEPKKGILQRIVD